MFEGRRRSRELTKIGKTNYAHALGGLAAQMAKSYQLPEANQALGDALLEINGDELAQIQLLQQGLEAMIAIADSFALLKQAYTLLGRIEEKLAYMPFSPTIDVMMKTLAYQKYYLDRAYQNLEQGTQTPTIIYRTEGVSEVAGFPLREDTPVTWDRNTVVLMRQKAEKKQTSLPEPEDEYGWSIDMNTGWSELEATHESDSAA